MRAVLYGILAVAVATAAAPQQADAQDSRWWDWALPELVEDRAALDDVLNRRDGDRRDREARRGVSLEDIIFGRRDDRRDDRRAERRDRDARRDNRGGNDRGPAFCRSGEGHPVHGRRWCQEKGFGLGSGGVLWERRGGWEDVILRSPREDRRRGALDRGGLIDVLGDVVYGQMVDESRRMGRDEPLTGRWVRPGGTARVLQVRSGTIPFAELTDVDGDGRVDVVLVPGR